MLLLTEREVRELAGDAVGHRSSSRARTSTAHRGSEVAGFGCEEVAGKADAGKDGATSQRAKVKRSKLGR